MKSVLLVEKKLKGDNLNQVAKGEFFIEDTLAFKLTGISSPWEAKKEAAGVLGWDFVAEGFDKIDISDPWGRVDLGQRGYEKPVYSSIENLCENLTLNEVSFNNLNKWKKETDLFVFALIDGPFQTLSSLLDYNQFLMDLITKPEIIEKAVHLISKKIEEVIFSSIENGADGIILGEDIAYARGLIVSPKILKEVFLPAISEIISKVDKPVVFHSDGDLNEIVSDIAKTGISGLHSLEESSGMSIQEIRNVVGEKICLFGGFDLTNFFDLNDVELLEKVRVIIELGRKYGPYVFGTSAGILDDNLNPDKVKMVYSAAR